jgi:hypothetical protein
MATRIAAVQSRPFYIFASLLMALIAIVGFWPTYFGPLVAGRVVQPLVIHLHTIVFGGWLVLFLVQAGLAATGRVAWHIRLGRVGIAYGALLIVVGLTTGVIRAGGGGQGQNPTLLLATTSDMICFATFFSLAVAWRSKPQLHKRAMVVAATMLLIAPVSRMWFLPEDSARTPVLFSIWMLPVLIAVVYDLLRRGLLHPVYVAGIAAFFIRVFVPRAIAPTETWSGIAGNVFAFFGV